MISKIGFLTAAFADLRSHDCLWTTAGHTIRIANLYGPCGGTDADLMETSALARSALIRAEAGGGGPAVILGDYNSAMHDLPCA